MALDLTDFLARNRQVGGLNARLADALERNLSSSQIQPAVRTAPGLFGVGDRSDQGERPRVRGGSLAGLAGVLTGGVGAFPSMIAGLALNDALGNRPSASLFGAARSLFSRDRGDSFRDIGNDRRGRERTGPRGERGRQVE